MEHNFELSNANGLDDSISSAMGLEYSDFCCGADGDYSNAASKDTCAGYVWDGTKYVCQRWIKSSGADGKIYSVSPKLSYYAPQTYGAEGDDAGGSTTTSPKKGIDPELIKQGIGVATGLFSKLQEKRASGDEELDRRCGKKPLIVITGDKKRKYDACVSDFYKQKDAASARQADLEGKKLTADAEASKLQQMQVQSQAKEPAPSTTTSSDKFLGMPKKVGIAVAVVGGLALVVGGILIIRKMRKK